MTTHVIPPLTLCNFPSPLPVSPGNIPLELRLSVTGLRDSVWVRPDHVTVPPRGERDVMLTFQPRDRHSGGRGQLLLTVQPDGTVYEGEFRNGRRQGVGTMRYASGETETGQWQDGALTDGTAAAPEGDADADTDATDGEAAENE